MERDLFIKEVIDWLVHIALAIVITLLIVNFVGQFTIVQGNSMLPTLKHNDILIIEKLTQRFSQLRQEDIIVIRIPELLGEGKTYAVKRIVATEGQKITIRVGQVFVDGTLLNETYTNGADIQITEGLHDDMTVPEGYIYVLGDNRLPGESKDSRTFGPVEINKVAGRVLFRLFPFNGLGPVGIRTN